MDIVSVAGKIGPAELVISPVVGVRCRVMQAADVGPFGVEGRGAGDADDCGFVARGRGDRSVPNPTPKIRFVLSLKCFLIAQCATSLDFRFTSAV